MVHGMRLFDPSLESPRRDDSNGGSHDLIAPFFLNRLLNGQGSIKCEKFNIRIKFDHHSIPLVESFRMVGSMTLYDEIFKWSLNCAGGQKR